MLRRFISRSFRPSIIEFNERPTKVVYVIPSLPCGIYILLILRDLICKFIILDCLDIKLITIVDHSFQFSELRIDLLLFFVFRICIRLLYGIGFSLILICSCTVFHDFLNKSAKLTTNYLPSFMVYSSNKVKHLMLIVNKICYGISELGCLISEVSKP